MRAGRFAAMSFSSASRTYGNGPPRGFPVVDLVKDPALQLAKTTTGNGEATRGLTTLHYQMTAEP